MKKTTKKILITIPILLLVTIVGLIAFMIWSVNANSIVHKSNEVKLGSNSNTKKALIIYQPARSSITTDIANSIGQTLNKNGYQVTLNYPSNKISYDIDKYDVVVLGTPIYVGKCSPVLEKYIKKTGDFKGKKILLFATCSNKNDLKGINHLAKLVKGTDKIKKIKLLKGETNEADKSIKELIH